jgi:hypothetical protein
MRTILLFALQFIVLVSTAQRECASADYIKQQRLTKEQYKETPQAVESFVQQTLSGGGPSTTLSKVNASTIIRIPVVVHVMYNNAGNNISEEQIKSQIDALNRDFRRTNKDAVNTPDYFKPVAADVMIEFFLATSDPKGRPTKGIVRKQSNVAEWTMDDDIKFSAKGGSDAWDSKSYLNIWVGPLRKILGYSSEPGSPANKDGIVISTRAFGTIGVSAPFNLGRTAVHEVGHWLGLKHIWGDTYCGDDGIDDTPKQSTYTTGCPSGIRISCSNGPNGSMYMNYMDFTNDECMNLFTNGQKNRMRSLFYEGGSRSVLAVSKGLNAPWNFEPEVEEIPVSVTVLPAKVSSSIFPNPAGEEITLNAGDNQWIGKDVQLFNMSGLIIRNIRITNLTQKISLSGMPKGIYIIKGETAGIKMYHKIARL